MKKMGLFLIAFALATTAFVSQPAAAKPAPLCNPPACLIGPGCCVDAHCATYCNNLSPGSVPHCSSSQGGCCSCEIVG